MLSSSKTKKSWVSKCKNKEAQCRVRYFLQKLFFNKKMAYYEEEMQGKNSNLWVKQLCDIMIRFITTLPIIFYSFTKTCVSRPFSLSKWESEKKESSWAKLIHHWLRTEWTSISCMLCFSLQTICTNNKKKKQKKNKTKQNETNFDRHSFGEKRKRNIRIKPKRIPVYTAEIIRERPMLKLRKSLS